MRRLALALAAALLPLTASADESLWQRLKTEPHLVVLTRHTESQGRNLLAWDESGNCRGEAVLTGKGRRQARDLGERLAALGIRPAAVISSPMCRCRDTARLAFGSEPVTDPELREVASADGARTAAFVQRAQELVARHRGAGPVVFVSHRPNIDQLTMEILDEGDLLVGRAAENGEIEVLGRIAAGH